MFCKNCGMEIEDGMMFCPNCGDPVEAHAEETSITSDPQDQNQFVMQDTPVEQTPIEQVEVITEATPVEQETVDQTHTIEQAAPQMQGKFCRNCGSMNSLEDAFCQICGTPFEAEMDTIPNVSVNQTNTNNTIKKSGINKGIIIGVAAVVVVGVIAAGIFLAGSMIGNKNKMLYVKDNEINMLKGKKPVVIGDDIYEDNYGMGYDSVKWQVTVTDDKKYVFYPQNYSSYNDGYKLYRSSLTNTKAEPVKVDSDITSYEVLDDNTVIYLKSTGKLSKSNMKEQTKIASDASWFEISNDQKKIVWAEKNSDGTRDLYAEDTNLKKGGEKIASDITTLYSISDDLTKIVYTKEDTLYILSDLKDGDKVASDVSDIYVTNTEGKVELYYTQAADDMESMDLWIDDDLAADDDAMKEPVIEDYQREETRSSFWGTTTQTVTDDSYYDAVDAYNEKNDRDYLRENLNSNTQTTKTLYYYKEGSGETAVYENGLISNLSSADTQIVVSELNMDKIEKVKFSKLYEAYTSGSYSSVTEAQDKCFGDAYELVYYSGEKKIALDVDPDDYDIDNISSLTTCSETGNMYFILYDKESDGTGELTKVNYKDKSEKTEKVADDVNEIVLSTDKDIYYVADVSKDAGDLYKNADNTAVATDVYPYSVSLEKDDSVYYMTDVKDSEGTLCRINGKKGEKLADDVAYYFVNEDGGVAMLVDYSTKRYKGDLVTYNNKKVKTVDTDVSEILYY